MVPALVVPRLVRHSLPQGWCDTSTCACPDDDSLGADGEGLFVHAPADLADVVVGGVVVDPLVSVVDRVQGNQRGRSLHLPREERRVVRLRLLQRCERLHLIGLVTPQRRGISGEVDLAGIALGLLAAGDEPVEGDARGRPYRVVDVRGAPVREAVGMRRLQGCLRG